MKKYKLLERESNGLYRIQALRDFSNVKSGDLGGFVESENNLSHEGNAWVYGDAEVYGNAWVCGNAKVYGNVGVYGGARVYGNAWVYGNARVYGGARVYGNAWVYGNAEVYGGARVYGDARVYGNAEVYGDARVYGGEIKKSSDYIVLKNISTSGRYYTYNFSSDSWSIGCFKGNTEELLKHLEDNGTELQKKEYKLSIKYVQDLEKLR